jgi:GTP-binding protein
LKTRNFIDQARFTVRAGHGGDGCTSFRAESHQPRGGPDGGNGGNGGDVILLADEGLSTLAELTYDDIIEAENGEDGGPKKQRGRDGDDKVVRVPPGTVVYQEESNEKLGQLREDGDELVVAEGGDGGRGNSGFVTSQRQAPSFKEFGTPGEEIPLRLELKLIADVGFVGAPNAGKSTLLSALTGANPKIADHSFTTQSPNLGALFRNHEQITLCDIPGLIENAHKGAGLGLDFLRHVERTRLLVHVVDLSGTHPLQTYRAIEKELREYSEELVNKPRVLVLNKVDRVDWDVYNVFMEEIDPPGPIVVASALEGTGLKTLRDVIWSQHEILAETSSDDEDEFDRIVRMEQNSPTRVQKLGDRYILQGDMVEDLVQRFDLRNPEAQSYVRQKLLSQGVHKKLEAAGCEPGDTIQVNDQVFNYTG